MTTRGRSSLSTETTSSGRLAINGTQEAGHQVVIIVAVVVIEAVDINEEVVETPLIVSKA